MEDALGYEIESGSAVHAALDQFQAVDLPLDRTVAPGFDDGGAHSWLVLPEPCDEAAEIGRGCSVQPGRQSGGIVLAQKISEGADNLGCLALLRRGAAERFSEGAILRRQRSQVASEPSGDAARRGDPNGPWSSRCPSLPTRSPAPDDIVATREAVCVQLPVKRGGAVLAFLPAGLNEGEMAVEPARTRCATIGHEPACPHPAAHGVAGRAETASDLLGRQTFAVEAQGRLTAITSSARHLRLGCGLPQARGGRGILLGAVGHAPDLGLVSFDHAAQRLECVDEQVPAIRDLRRRRRSRTRSLGIGPRAVTADDSHARMGSEPIPHRCRRAAGQQVDDAPPLQVAHDGAVGPAASLRPIVDAHHPRRRRRYGPATTDQAQDGVAADPRATMPATWLSHPSVFPCHNLVDVVAASGRGSSLGRLPFRRTSVPLLGRGQ